MDYKIHVHSTPISGHGFRAWVIVVKVVVFVRVNLLCMHVHVRMGSQSRFVLKHEICLELFETPQICH